MADNECYFVGKTVNKGRSFSKSTFTSNRNAFLGGVLDVCESW